MGYTVKQEVGMGIVWGVAWGVCGLGCARVGV